MNYPLLKPPISVAIVGLGRAGWHLHLEYIVKIPGFRIVAVADPDQARCDEAVQATGCQTFPSLAAALAGSDASLFIIATPSSTHYHDALQVLQAGRHCLLEKPIAFSTADARELMTLAQSKGLRLFVNHALLHLAEFHHLKGVVDSGVLGPLFHLRAFIGSFKRRWDWQTLWKNGGGQLSNTCPHTLSVVLPLLGSPVTRVYSNLRNIKDAGDAEDHVHLVLDTAGEVTADIVVTTACALAMPKWVLCGKNGTLVSDGLTSRLRHFDAIKVEPRSVIDAAAPGRKYLSEDLPWREEEISIQPSPVRPFHENILDVLTGNAEPVVTPESAVEVVRVTELARLAASVRSLRAA